MSDTPQFLEPGDDGPEQATAVCEACGWSVTGNAAGRNSVTWQLSRHKYGKHKEKSASPKTSRRKSTGPTQQESAQPVFSVVREIGADMGGGRRTPTEADLTSGLGKALGYGTIAVASFAAETDPHIPDGPAGEQVRDELIDYLSLEPAAARDVMRPIAKALAPTQLNRKYGKTVLDNVDVVASVGELVKLGMHYRHYFRNRAYMSAAAQNTGAAPVVPTPPGAQQQAAPAPGSAQSPPPSGGVVMTPDMVQRMQR